MMTTTVPAHASAPSGAGLSAVCVSLFDENSPTSPPPYSSLLQDIFDQNTFFRYKEELRKVARHPFTLHAGQSLPDNGSLGMRMTPVFSPEVLHGSIYSSSI